MIRANSFTDKVVESVRSGGIGVVRTDTIYGIVAQAGDKQAVERVYNAKGRTPSKPPIVLIASLDQMFDAYDDTMRRFLGGIWPAKKSIILPSKDAPQWLTRGGNTVAYRMPSTQKLQQLLEKTGPLIAPSANHEGAAPATTIKAAEAYFGDVVDFYVDEGTVTDPRPSELYLLHPDYSLERLR